VPDADIAAAVAQSFVEGHPGWPVLPLVAARVRLELLERPPVLHDDPRPEYRAEKSRVRPRLQLLHHPRHGQEHRQPLVNLPELVDAHADQEDDEIALDVGRHPLGIDAGHGSSDVRCLACALQAASRESARAGGPPSRFRVQRKQQRVRSATGTVGLTEIFGTQLRAEPLLEVIHQHQVGLGLVPFDVHEEALIATHAHGWRRC